MIDKLEDIKKAHNVLMIEYVNIINHISNLPFVFRRFQSIYFRFFVKLFCESHIKSKLNYLADSYIQLAQTITSDEKIANDHRDWLMQTEKGVRDFADTLSSWQSIRGLFSVSWPFVGGFLLSTLTIDAISQVFKKLVVLKPITTKSELDYAFLILLGMFFSSTFISYFILNAHVLKRCLFFPHSYNVCTIALTFEKDQESKNVYQIEDRMFDLLGKGKPREFPIRNIAASLTLFLWGSGIMIFIYGT